MEEDKPDDVRLADPTQSIEYCTYYETGRLIDKAGHGVTEYIGVVEADWRLEVEFIEWEELLQYIIDSLQERKRRILWEGGCAIKEGAEMEVEVWGSEILVTEAPIADRIEIVVRS